MWEEGARIYGTPGVHNNSPHNIIFHVAKVKSDIAFDSIKNINHYEQ